jgi:hypothetical protein
MAPPPRAADLPFPRVAYGLEKIPPLIRMIAYLFQRSLLSAYLRQRRDGLFAVLILISIGFLSACQSRSVAKNESAYAAKAALLVKAPERSTVTTKPESIVLSTQHDKIHFDSALIPNPKAESITTQVGSRLRSSFDVKIEGTDTLWVRKASTSTAMPSLFEEAIILGKLRAFLKSATATAPNTSVSFHNGQATVTLPSTINSGTASVLIAKMLSLEGMNVVRAIFSKEPIS